LTEKNQEARATHILIVGSSTEASSRGGGGRVKELKKGRGGPLGKKNQMAYCGAFQGDKGSHALAWKFHHRGNDVGGKAKTEGENPPLFTRKTDIGSKYRE